MTNYRDRYQNGVPKKIEPKKEGGRLLSTQREEDYLAEAESERFVKAYYKYKSRYIPEIDYKDPSTFAFFGSAEKYYEDSVNNIYNSYPYDGSKAEKVEWALSASYLDIYLLEHEYPKEVGSLSFPRTTVTNNTGAPTSGADDKPYYTVQTPKFIKFFGGPQVNTVYNTSKKRESNIKIDGTTGNTVEFWLKKENASWLGGHTREVILDVNSSNTATDSEEFGRMTVELRSPPTSSPNSSPFFFTYKKGTTGTPTPNNTSRGINLGDATVTKDSVADGKWHHYAITAITSGTSTVYKLYIDGTLNHTVTHGSVVGPVNTFLSGTIGATTRNGASADIGRGQLNASLDELRIWKTARTEKQIGRFWYSPVHGGTDKDHTNADLGVYYKFNEGIIGTEEADKVVLDYSGRINNGEIVNWDSTIRSSDSAITLSEKISEKDFKELGDPIINPDNAKVTTVKNTLRNIGRSHDGSNMSSLKNSVPQYFTDTDTELFIDLLQIMSSAFDDIFIKIKNLPKMKDFAYQEFFSEKGSYRQAKDNRFLIGCEDISLKEFTGHHAKPWVSNILEHFGMVSADLFQDATMFERFFNRTEEVTFEHDLEETKRLILSNIHKNLIHILKTKGTESSFRNLIRCFGVDDEIIKLNAYGDNEVYELITKPIYTTVKQKSLSFEGQNHRGTIHQTAAPGDTDASPYIKASSGATPYTMEGNFIFPKYKSEKSMPMLSASLFGMHSVEGSSNPSNPLTVLADDAASFQVRAVKRSVDQPDAYFELSSTSGVITAISSSYFPDVYDNQHWNLSVRIGTREGIDFNITTPSEYYVQFSGYNYDLDVLKSEFHVSSSLSVSDYAKISQHDKAVFVGSHKTNFTGGIITSTDVRVLGFNTWRDALADDELREHAQNSKVFGRKKPQSISNFDNGSNLTMLDSLLLRWQFEGHSESDSSGEMLIQDMSSGSVSSGLKLKHNGKAEGLPNSAEAISQEFLPGVEYFGPDNSYSSDRVKIKNTEVDKFKADSKPVTYNFAFEKSMYQVISKEMVNFFAGIVGFGNIIGEPVNKYRRKYKLLEKIRNRFFLRVNNEPDIDKFIEYYKWIDSSLTKFLAQLVPASSFLSSDIKDVVESHILERNKYEHKAPTMEFKDPADKTFSILGVNELLYDWEHGHAQTVFEQSVNKKAILLDGQNDHVLISDQDDFSFTDGSSDKPFSISAWVLVGDISVDNGPFVSKVAFDSGANKTEYLFKHFNGELRMFLYDTSKSSSGDQIRALANAASLTSNTWHHVVMTYDGSGNQSGINLYTDGSATAATKSSQSSPSGGYDSMRNTVTPLILGATQDGAANSTAARVFEDKMADVVIFNKELSASEVSELHNSGKVKDITKFSAFGNVISWWKMGDDLDHSDTNGIIDYVGGFHGSLKNGASVINSPNLLSDIETINRSWDDSRPDKCNTLWLKERSEVSADRAAIKNIIHTEVDGSTYATRRLVKPYRLTADNVVTSKDGFNRDANKNTELYKVINTGKSITLKGSEITFDTPCQESTDPNKVRIYRGKTDVTGTDGYMDGDSDLILPFTLVSSSAGSDLPNLKDNLKITNNHLDFNISGESSLKGPFAETHIGGMPHNKVGFGTISRPEAYSLNVDSSTGTLTITPPPTDVPKSMFYRDIPGTRFANIGNIKHTTASVVLGNFGQEYEVVMTNGRSSNNNYFIDHEGDFTNSSEYHVDTRLPGVTSYKVPDRGKTSHVIVNRFSSPGSPEANGTFAMDAESEEYSVYNTLNYRNLVVRDTLDLLHAESSSQFGYRSGYSSEDTPVAATATIKFSQPPQDNAKFVIASTGTSPRILTYTFKASSPNASNQEFSGGSAQLAATNLANLIGSSVNGHGLDRIKVSDSNNGLITLTQFFAGESGNIKILSNANNVSISGFSGGKSSMASVHKTNRNSTRTKKIGSNHVDHDSFFVQHPMPTNDFGYSWITASANEDVYSFLEKNENYGYQHTFGPLKGTLKSEQSLSFLSTSELQSGLDFVYGNFNSKVATVTITSAMHIHTGDEISFKTVDGTTITAQATNATSTNDNNNPTFARDASDKNETAKNLAICLNANSKLSAVAVANVVTIKQAIAGDLTDATITLTEHATPLGMSATDFVDISTTNIDPASNLVTYTGNELNSQVLNKQGPYGWPTWKQIRGYEHPISRYERKNAKLSIVVGKNAVNSFTTVFPETIQRYKWDPNPRLQEIDLGGTSAVQKLIETYNEVPATNRFNPITVTFHGAGNPEIRANAISQQQAEMYWTNDETSLAALGSQSLVGVFGPNPSLQTRLASLKITVGNEETMFSNFNLTDRLNIEDVKVPENVSTILDELGTMTLDEEIFLTEINYIETLYPREINTFTKESRIRELFDFYAWRDLLVNRRIILGGAITNYVGNDTNLGVLANTTGTSFIFNGADSKVTIPDADSLSPQEELITSIPVRSFVDASSRAEVTDHEDFTFVAPVTTNIAVSKFDSTPANGDYYNVTQASGFVFSEEVVAAVNARSFSDASLTRISAGDASQLTFTALSSPRSVSASTFGNPTSKIVLTEKVANSDQYSFVTQTSTGNQRYAVLDTNDFFKIDSNPNTIAGTGANKNLSFIKNKDSLSLIQSALFKNQADSNGNLGTSDHSFLKCDSIPDSSFNDRKRAFALESEKTQEEEVPFSVCLWIKPELNEGSLGNPKGIVGKGRNSSSGREWYFAQTGKKLTFYTYSNGSAAADRVRVAFQTSVDVLDIGSWQHIAVTYDAPIPHRHRFKITSNLNLVDNVVEVRKGIDTNTTFNINFSLSLGFGNIGQWEAHANFGGATNTLTIPIAESSANPNTIATAKTIALRMVDSILDSGLKSTIGHKLTATQAMRLQAIAEGQFAIEFENPGHKDGFDGNRSPGPTISTRSLFRFPGGIAGNTSDGYDLGSINADVNDPRLPGADDGHPGQFAKIRVYKNGEEVLGSGGSEVTTMDVATDAGDKIYRYKYAEHHEDSRLVVGHTPWMGTSTEFRGEMSNLLLYKHEKDTFLYSGTSGATDIRPSNKILTPQDIKRLYNDGKIFDYTTNSKYKDMVGYFTFDSSQGETSPTNSLAAITSVSNLAPVMENETSWNLSRANNFGTVPSPVVKTQPGLMEAEKTMQSFMISMWLRQMQLTSTSKRTILSKGQEWVIYHIGQAIFLRLYDSRLFAEDSKTNYKYLDFSAANFLTASGSDWSQISIQVFYDSNASNKITVKFYRDGLHQSTSVANTAGGASSNATATNGGMPSLRMMWTDNPVMIGIGDTINAGLDNTGDFVNGASTDISNVLVFKNDNNNFQRSNDSLLRLFRLNGIEASTNDKHIYDYRRHPLASELVSWWKLDQPAGNNQPDTIGSVPAVPALNPSDPSSDTTNFLKQKDFQDNSFSLSGWFKHISAGAIISKSDRETGSNHLVTKLEWSLVVNASNKLELSLYDDRPLNPSNTTSVAYVKKTFTSTNALTAGFLDHIVVVYKASSDTVDFYINNSSVDSINPGTLTGENVTGTAIYTSMSITETKVHFGAEKNGSSLTNQLSNGTMFNTVIYNAGKEITATEAAALYNNGNAWEIKQSSVYSDMLSYYKLNSGTFTDLKDNSTAVATNVALDNNPGLNIVQNEDRSFTIAFWFKKDKTTSTKEILGKWGNSSADQEYRLQQNNRGLKLTLKDTTGTDAQAITSVYTSGATILNNSTSAWQHVVITYDGVTGLVNFYVDSARDQSGDAASGGTGHKGSNAEDFFEMQDGTADFFLGSTSSSPGVAADISNLLIFKHAELTAPFNNGEVIELYNQGFVYDYKKHSRESDLVLWWKLDDATGTTVQDSSGQSLTGTSNTSMSPVTSTLNSKNFQDKPFTVSFWMNSAAVANANTWTTILSKRTHTSLLGEWKVGLATNNRIFVGLIDPLVQGANKAVKNYFTADNAISQNEWKFITITYDPSGASDSERVKFYVGDHQPSSGTTLSPSSAAAVGGSDSDQYSSMRPSTCVLRIGNSAQDTSATGGNGSDDPNFTGMLSNVIIYNTTLSSTEVNGIYNSGFPHDYRELTSYANAISYWKLDHASANDAIDSKSGNTGANVGVVQESSSSSALAKREDEDIPFSFGFWIKRASSDTCFPLGKMANANTLKEYSLKLSTDMTLSLNDTTGLSSGANSGPHDYTVAGVYSNSDNNNWVHYVVTYNPSTTTLKVYKNGALVNSQGSGTQANYSEMQNTNAKFSIGGLTNGNPFIINGSMSHVIVFKNHELSASEATELYNDGFTYDYSTHSQYNNAVAWWKLDETSNTSGVTFVDSKSNHDAVANGATTSPIAASSSGLQNRAYLTKPITISAWIKTDTLSNVDNVILSKFAGMPNNEFSFSLTGGGQLRFFVSGWNSAAAEQMNYRFTTTGGTITTNQWYHVAMTYHPDSTQTDGGSVIFYINGVAYPVETGVHTAGVGSGTPFSHPIINTTADVVIGNLAGTLSEPFDGGIANVLLWYHDSNITPLSSEDIKTIANLGFCYKDTSIPRLAETVGYWKLNEEDTESGSGGVKNHANEDTSINAGQGTNVVKNNNSSLDRFGYFYKTEQADKFNYTQTNGHGIDMVDVNSSTILGVQPIFITSSRWPLDARNDFTELPLDLSISSFNDSVPGKCFSYAVTSHATRGEGIFQNDYNTFGCGANFQYGTPPAAPVYSRRVPQKPIDHYIGTVTITNINNLANNDKIEFNTPDGAGIKVLVGNSTTETNTNSPTFRAETSNDVTAQNLQKCLNANSRLTATVENNKVTIKSVANGLKLENEAITITVAHSSTAMTKTDFIAQFGPEYLAGEAEWKAASQLGSNPFSTDFEKHAENYRQVGQDHSLVPEFIISNHVEDVVLNAENDFASLSNRDGFLSVTGAVYNASSGDLSVNENFYKTYGISDMMKYFGVTMEEVEDSNLGNPLKLTLRCKAALKFTPYRGFYPAERVQQITEMFTRGYMQEFDFETTQTKPAFVKDQETLLKTKVRANMQQSIKPLFAPGVLMNSIKAGMAVDYPLFGASTTPSFQTVSSSSGINNYQDIFPVEAGLFTGTPIISVYGDYMAVAQDDEDGLHPAAGNNLSGKVYIYKLQDTGKPTKEWVKIQEVTAPTRQTNTHALQGVDNFGIRMYMSENHLAVLSGASTSSGNTSSYVFIYDRVGDTFTYNTTGTINDHNAKQSALNFVECTATVPGISPLQDVSARGASFRGLQGELAYIDDDILVLGAGDKHEVWIWKSHAVEQTDSTSIWNFEDPETAAGSPAQIIRPPTGTGIPDVGVGFEGRFGDRGSISVGPNVLSISAAPTGRLVRQNTDGSFSENNEALYSLGGAVFIYTISPDTGLYTYSSVITPPTRTPGFAFGYATEFSEDGTMLLIGAPGGPNGGSVFVYTKTSEGNYSFFQEIKHDQRYDAYEQVEATGLFFRTINFGQKLTIVDNNKIVIVGNDGVSVFFKGSTGQFEFVDNILKDVNYEGFKEPDFIQSNKTKIVTCNLNSVFTRNPVKILKFSSTNIADTGPVENVDTFKRLAISPASSFDTEYTSLITTMTGSIVNNSTDSGVPRLSGSVYKRVTFEEMMNPDSLKGIVIEDQEPHPSASIYHADKYTGKVMDFPFRFGELDATNNEIDIGVSSFSPNKTLAESLKPYRLAINNFCAETINFFLKDGKTATLESNTNVFPLLKSGQTYKMRLEVVNSNTRMYDRHSAFGPPVDEGTIKLLSDGQDTVFENQHAYSPFVPPFLDAGSTPYVDITFTPTETRNYTLDEIRNGATYEYRNFSTIPENSSLNSNYLNAMSLSASINLDSFVTYQPVTDDAGADIERRARWVIQPRWETPVLNFISSEGSALRIDNGQVATVKSRTSPWQKRNWENFYISKPKSSDVPYLTSSIGMWHQAGNILKSSREGYTLRIQPHPDVASPENQLADHVGFTQKNSLSAQVGQLRKNKVVYEAVVAIPFIEPEYPGGDIRYFDLDKELVGEAVDINKRFKDRYNRFIAGLDTTSAEFLEITADYERRYNQPGQMPKEVIAYQLRMQEKYVIPEEFLGKMMYVFQYSAEFTKQDLANIWQNVAPTSDFSAKDLRYSTVDNRQGISGTSQDIQYVSNFLNDIRPTEIPMDFKNSKIRWVVLKVKQKAIFDLNQVKRNSLKGPSTFERLEVDNSRGTFGPTPELEGERYSFNWPYDFFSIVELVKLEGKVDIFDSTPQIVEPPEPEED